MDPGGQTLPLFDQPPTFPTSAPGAGARSDALDKVLHTYWSASVEGHALGAAALRAAYPDERRALVALAELEGARKELARRLLAEIWHIRIGAEEGAACSGFPA